MCVWQLSTGASLVEQDKKELAQELESAPKADLPSTDVHEARNASLLDMSEVEESRTGKHSGTAGGDPQKGSIEIDFGSGQSVSRTKTGTEKQVESVLSKPELQKQAGDGNAFAELYLKALATRPATGSENISAVAREPQANTLEIQSIQHTPDVPADQRILAKQIQDMRSQSKILGVPTDAIDQYAKEELVFKLNASENHFIDNSLSPELSARVAHASGALLDAGIDRGFNPDEIRELNIAPEDIGSALALYLCGPDYFHRVGREEAKNFGDRILIFGVAPVLGAIQTAQEKWDHNRAELGVDGSVNFLAGTSLGIIIERCHPVIIAGTVVSGFGAAINDLVWSQQARERNAELAEINSKVEGLSTAEVLKHANRVSALVGPEAFDALYMTVTGGVGIPEGYGLAKSMNPSLLKLFPEIDIKDSFGRLIHEAGAVWKVLLSLADNRKLQTANGAPGLGHEHVLFSMGDSSKDNIFRRKEHHYETDVPLRNMKPVEFARLVEHPKVAEILNRVAQNGKIDKLDGQRIADMIAVSLMAVKADINTRNIAFAVTLDGGKPRLIVGVSGCETVPGTANYAEHSLLPHKSRGVQNRRADSEYKILDSLLQEGYEGGIVLYTEQAPCDSCAVLLSEFKQDGTKKINIKDVSYCFESFTERRAANIERGEEWRLECQRNR